MTKFHGALIATLALTGAAACSNDSNGGGPADLPAPSAVTTGTGDLAAVTATLTAFKIGRAHV